MQFTLVFNCKDTVSMQVGLIFAPHPVWICGHRIHDMHPEDPKYRSGDFHDLMRLEAIDSGLTEGKRQVVVIVQEEGLGTQESQDILCEDLREMDYSVEIFSFQ